MFTGRRVLVASRKSDLAWALHHEVMRLTQWELIGIIDPRVSDAFDRTCAMADVVLIEADDLIWLWDHRLDATQKTLSTVRAVVILTDQQMLDVITRAQQSCGLLLREEYGDVPIDLLELAIKGYMSVSSPLMHRLMTNRLRLDIVGTFSPEELSVLAYIGAAMPNREIAQTSCLAESRVKTLVHLVTHKLRMHNRTAVAVFAAANGLTPITSGMPATPIPIVPGCA
ncbi:LuxR C-terminal-related transcriptional regulator [Ferrovibrio terrae]|uniref:helix-turn-helix transcriptional regulator n=1 Tax=Ferrovibrio terrae TaxID=2594003 RepID=UPI003137A424